MKTAIKAICIGASIVMMVAGPLSAQEVAGEQEQRARENYYLGKIYKEHGLLEDAARAFQRAYDTMEESAQPAPQPQAQTAEEDTGNEYLVGIGDTLQISVWENEDLNKTVKVRPDGRISFPLIDEVQAEGITIARLDAEITGRLREYVRYPDVSIALQEIGGQRVIVLGEVRSPGVYSLGENRSILEMVALAGGFTPNAVLKSVVVVKGGLAQPQAIRLDLNKYLNKGMFVRDRDRFTDNIILEPRDIVYVPKKFIADLNYTLTQILGPITQGRLADETISYFENNL
jgi:polysaccharide export outer membrane protein